MGKRAKLLATSISLSVLSTFVVLAWVAMPARAGGDAVTSVRFMNAQRADHGRGALATSSFLQKLAQRHSEDMARDGMLYHSENLPQEVPDWRLLGENVGEGPTIESIDDAFMQSPEHRSNILDRFTLVGVGVAYTPDGTLYVTQIFELPDGPANPAVHRNAIAPPRHIAPVPAASPVVASAPAIVHIAPRPVVKVDPSVATQTVAALEVLSEEG